MTVPIGEWGRRLSDVLRTALESRDFARARQLAHEGDGQARSLAKEYTFMYRGLGITIRMLLPLLQETAVRADGARGSTDSAVSAASLIYRFRNNVTAAMRQVWSEPVCANETQGSLQEEIGRTARVLDAGEARFEQEQARLAEEIVRAIDALDAARALALLRRKEQEQYLPLHDRLVRFMAECFGWVLRCFGAEELLRFHLATAEGQRAGFEKWEKMPTAEFAWTSAFLLKQHMGEVTVHEDELKFTIDQKPCGSGGNLRLSHAYDGLDALPFVEAPGPLTFGQPRLPVYCSHCAIWNGVATLRWFGRAHWVFENAARADGGCRLHIYKKREDAPAEYTRLLEPAGLGAALIATR
ncbi:MAG: hypothetical protein ACTS6J_01050 [Burkholderiales bacterium]